MALSNREKWMSQMVVDYFGSDDFHTPEFFGKDEVKEMTNSFFEPDGHRCLFVSYGPPLKKSSDGKSFVEVAGAHPELRMSTGEDKLIGKSVYFAKAVFDKDISKTSANDNDVLFGEVSENSLSSLNLICNMILKPYSSQLEESDWGVCEEEQKKEFTHVFDKFCKELKEAIGTLSGTIQLKKYDSQYEKEAKNIQGLSANQNAKNVDPGMKTHFQNLFKQWIDDIGSYLEENETGMNKMKDKDIGPKSELDYWRKRMQKLTCLSEEMRSAHCQTVQKVLSNINKSSGDSAESNIYLLQSQWRTQDMKVTEALNEAKDNVKYLTTLEQFIEPLYTETPEVVKDTLPALMNSIKMIHTIARYYNTNDRMTELFKKITNQMILCCKNAILDGETSDEKLWDHERFPPEKLIPTLKSCIELNKSYQKQYEITKERLMNMPKGKQFEFSPNQIFGKFDLFCRRVSKLIELFSTIQQFQTLSKHNLENMEEIIDKFDKSVKQFKNKKHKLLNFEQNIFDRDFVEFNVSVSSSETDLQQYIKKNFEVARSVEDALKLLKKFRAILKRDNLRSSLDAQYNTILQSYSSEINNVDNQYREKKAKVPTVRNLPEVAGAITWSRHLFRRISAPMENFPKDLLNKKDSKRLIQKYNKTGYLLFAFESVWRQAWSHEVEKAKAGLQATLIIRYPGSNKLYVNFDSEILTLIREAKCLSRIGIEIPESAKIVLLQEDKFKRNSNELQYVLREYERIVSKIRPNTKSLLVPHLEDLEYKLRPGMVTLTWTSMNIEGYLHHCHAGLSKLEQLIININDIMENRIENNLKALSKTVLVDLPQDSNTFSLDDFVEMQEKWIKHESLKLKSKNIEVEGAVEDLIQTICSYNLDKHVEAISAEEIQKLSKYYNWSMYQALLHATKYSLNAMKERICGRRNAPKNLTKPFFEVDLLLENGQCTPKPSLDDIQNAINRAASHVLKSTKHVQNWNQKDIPEDKREPFYDWIAKDKEIVKVILLLTGSIQGTRNAVNTFTESFEEYHWLWSKNITEDLKKFTAKSPQLEGYEEKLREFSNLESKIKSIQSAHQIGALNLTTNHLKSGLTSKIQQWKEGYARELHKKAKSSLDHLTDDIKQLKFKLQKKASDVDTLGNVMYALEDIRKKESDIDLQFRPVTEMYNLLELHLSNVMDKEEMDAKSILEKRWKELVQLGEQTRNSLHGQQAEFKKQLINGIRHLIEDVVELRKNFEENGPMVPGIAPKEALDRLKLFSEEYQVRKRRYESYHSGETLFGLPHQTYPALDETGREIELLEKLYNLYSKVNDTVGEWKNTTWLEISDKVDIMIDSIESYNRDCTKLPGVLRGWDAYKELKQKVEDMTKILPLVKELSKSSIRPRHWEEIIELTQKDIPYNSETFTLNQLLETNLLEFEADIEEITESADKQLKLEKELNENIISYWQQTELEIKSTKVVEVPCMLGGNILEIQETLEDHIMQLNQMNAMRYVTPFKQEVSDCIHQYNEVSDTIEKWLKVQVLWSSLVSVFKGGDIAKNMPNEAKKFAKLDKDWLKLMERANEQRNVIHCCTNDMLKSMLNPLQEDLEFCQKKLENYLESKRKLFPRFYFVSNAVLLKILSQGSDPNSVQEDFEKLFDAVARVRFNEVERKNIEAIIALSGGDQEIVELVEPVKAEGNIEAWLLALEHEMQRSVKEVCRNAAQECMTSDLDPFVRAFQSQVALLGIQMIWTFKVQEALEKASKEKNSGDLEKKRKEINEMLTKLSNMCLEETDSKIHRTKIETLVTIHVHQKDLYDGILSDVKTHKIKDASDFDWTKNTRLYWKMDDEEMAIQITDVEFIYSYEFLGAKERLCITPLTDRCYVTLSQALGMLYGGAPAGPAGTGKTETVKDLGCTLGVYVVVTNCSGEHKYRDMAKIFKGLCQSGLWGCFDEFNRIELATLSVVAAQVEAITAAKKADVKTFLFPNDPISVGLIKSCAYFITMNPGYAGRQELPENLKVLFRGVTMMQPDRQIIIKTKLASVGYLSVDVLSLKFTILYKLCEEQLSAQRHYDFGLRNILSVLRTAGNTKKKELNSDEEMLLARTLRDINLSKLVAQDIDLFNGLLLDIFPKQTKIPKMIYADVENGVKKLIKEKRLVERLNWLIKIIQLYETSLVRHGFMLVGPAGSGKTTIANILTEALTECQIQHKIVKMNPKSFTGQQMFGVMNNVTGEWTQGVFSAIWAKYNKPLKYHTWITCDGPVDAIWIENLNTVLDDNKILTLANSDRIPMTDNTKLVFEVENLNNASPATVSRCGIVFVSDTDLGWSPLFETWIEDMITDKQITTEDGEHIRTFVKKYLTDSNMFDYLLKNFVYVMYTPEVIRTSNLINLFDACLKSYTAKNDPVTNPAVLEKIFVYAMAWAIGGLFETEEREKFHKYIEGLGAPLPQISGQKMSVDKETVFDYYIKEDTKDWCLWEADTWEPPKTKTLEFSQLLIPTSDSTRAEYIINKISKLPDIRSEPRKEVGCQSCLIVGGTGTAKTSCALMYASKFDPNKMLFKSINFSSATTPIMFQDAIDDEVEKKQGKTFCPPGERLMTVFIDDMSMPFVNDWGDQITLEILRQLIELKGYYFLSKDLRGDLKTIKSLQYLGAMNHPGGGRNDIPNRIKRHFFIFNMTSPSVKSIENIYGRILTLLFNPKKFSQDVCNTKDIMTDATITLWDLVRKRLLPTPTKFHYVFNIRELSRVFQGIVTVASQSLEFKTIQNASNAPGKMKSDHFLVALWRHECERVFEDKLLTVEDKKVFHDFLDKVSIEKFKDALDVSDEEACPDLLFCDFQRSDEFDEYGDLVREAPFVYEACPSIDKVREIAIEKLNNYNEVNPSKKMNLVIFNDALKHLLRLCRIIGTKRGSALLVGVGGSGKQSLTKLASFICKQEFFQIALTKSYSETNLKDNIKELYQFAGPGGKSVTFILTDAEIKTENFLEYINSFLATGEIAGLIGKDDKDLFAIESKGQYMKERGKKGEDPQTRDLWVYAINRVRDCLHIVLSFSPVGSKFAERARKFPALFNGCTIDWFLPWPEEALVSVSHSFLSDFYIDTGDDPKIKGELEYHMGKVHNMVTDVCAIYFERMRRHVYVTPKSYLSFIDLYKDVYDKKYSDLNTEENNIRKGLEKLQEAAEGIAILKEDLAKEEIKLGEAAKKTDKLLKELEVENQKAKKKADEVGVVKQSCVEQAEKIAMEKADAEKDLAIAMPYLERAIGAVDSITPKDINELKSAKSPADTTKMILDAVHVILQLPLLPVKPGSWTIAKQPVDFIKDSFEEMTKGTMSNAKFLKILQDFSEHEKDNINDETVELLEPYLNLTLPDGRQAFDQNIAKKSNAALEGLCIWCGAMADYHNQSKIVKPKLELLEIKEASQKVALKMLAEAEAELEECNQLKARLKKKYDDQMAEKQALQDKAAKTKRKMDQANRLINGLKDERGRWENDANNFASLKSKLVGDVAKACAFVSYCGPFNAEFRQILLDEYFHDDLEKRSIPCRGDLALTSFLVDPATVGEWNLQGLPSDDLSVQNAIMVTRSSRYPLLIDPQGQAMSWIKKREPDLETNDLVININNPQLKDKLKLPLQEGWAVMVDGIDNEIDPMLDPILEKQVIVKGRTKLLKIADQEMDFDDKFMLYMTSRLANPHFSPELAAKTTIINFTVIQSGLEQQLLGRVLSKEQKSLEEQLTALLEDVTENTKTLQAFDKQLLEKLATTEGSLLDDVELIDVLATIKSKSKEVNQKLSDAKEKRIEINEKREQFRPVAARGAVIYFCIVEMSFVSWMYNTSLYQFLELFDDAIDEAPKAQLLKDRVTNIIDTMTYKVYRYINRGLFEKDKITFKLMVSLKILIEEGKLMPHDVQFFLKAGAGGTEDKTKPYQWIDPKAWSNLKALSNHRFAKNNNIIFKDLPDRISRNESAWRSWIDENEPENLPVPDLADKISGEPISHFLQLCLIRCVREDRTLLASTKFISDVLGAKYVQPVTDSVEDLWASSSINKPPLFLLSAGADPTNSIDDFAKKKKKFPTKKVSMGEEQDKLGEEEIKNGFITGGWVVLQNCHLDLAFMAKMEDILNPKNVEPHEDFRLWITCEPHPEFPLGLLQMAIKVTTEPPKGLKAGMYRTFTTMVNGDFLEKVEPLDQWRSMVYAVCFMHSIVQERRKFGPLGFCIPYEFNNSDLEASLSYIEKHLTNNAALGIQKPSWKAVKYMVCEIQYGGRITDNLDRRLFNTYGDLWMHDTLIAPNTQYKFVPTIPDSHYEVPATTEHSKILSEINQMFDRDSPIAFGLHPNADLTFRLKESVEMVNTLIDTQPKDAGAAGGKTPEAEVRDQLEKNMLPDLPENWNDVEMIDRIKSLKPPKGLSDVGMRVPLNVFLYQELCRFQNILNLVRGTMKNIIAAVDGTIIMTPDIVNAIGSIYDLRVPKEWVYDPTGAEISWLTPTLGGWLEGLKNRYNQLNNWYTGGRPNSYWLTGFFNPQGFLTGMKQELTRTKKGAWSLDEVDYKTEVKNEIINTDNGTLDRPINAPAEGVYVHGLYLEGAVFSKKSGNKLEDPKPKELYSRFPLLLVSAISTAKDENAGIQRARGEDKSNLFYSCPVYKYPRRNDKYLVFNVSLKCDNAGQPANQLKSLTAPMNWTLKGVALLCSKE